MIPAKMRLRLVDKRLILVRGRMWQLSNNVYCRSPLFSQAFSFLAIKLNRGE